MQIYMERIKAGKKTYNSENKKNVKSTHAWLMLP